MTNVLRFPTDVDRLVTVLSELGYSAEEVMESTEELWQWFGTLAGLSEVPNTAIRCAVVAGLQVAMADGVQSACVSAAPCSPRRPSEPAATSSAHGNAVGPRAPQPRKAD